MNLVDKNNNILEVDLISRNLVTIGREHHKTHDGDGYVVIYSALKNNTETIEVRVQTPDTVKWAHMIVEAEGALAATIEMWMSTTKTDAPLNRIVPFQRNHNSGNASGLTVCHTPGGAQAGAAKIVQYFGSASMGGRSVTRGGTNSRGEFIFKQNCAYLIKVTSRGDGNALSLILDWYEHISEVI